MLVLGLLLLAHYLENDIGVQAIETWLGLLGIQILYCGFILLYKGTAFRQRVIYSMNLLLSRTIAVLACREIGASVPQEKICQKPIGRKD